MLTDLARDDRRVDNEQDEFAEQLVEEPDAGVQQSPAQGGHAGLQLALHVSLADDDVLQTVGEGVLLQDIDQSEELIQVGILEITKHSEH